MKSGPRRGFKPVPVEGKPWHVCTIRAAFVRGIAKQAPDFPLVNADGVVIKASEAARGLTEHGLTKIGTLTPTEWGFPCWRSHDELDASEDGYFMERAVL